MSFATPVRSSPALHNKLDLRQFRLIHRIYFPEYKRARRKTDLCDHCRAYVRKIQPRTRAFLARAKDDMQNACPDYWTQLLRRARYKTLFSNHDLAESLTLLREVLNTVHERTYPALRRAAPQPEQIPHTEGLLATEAKLHLEIVSSYDFHMSAAKMEQSAMRELVDKLPRNTAYVHCDFMEKLPIPISGSETSDQFHGSQRKTLSVFTAYCVECSPQGKRSVTAVVLVSEIIELSALFGSMCVLECLKDVRGIGSLDMLYLGFDTGTHFRSYENMFYFLFHVAKTHKQKCRLNFLIEKHGKSMCDAEVFSPIRRWLSEFLLNPEAFCDTELEVVKVLKEYAGREERQNPDGTKFIIKVFNPDKPRTSHALSFEDDHLITRSYSWEAEPTNLTRFPVKISNCIFSPSAAASARFFSSAKLNHIS